MLLATGGCVAVLTCGAYYVYEVLTVREAARHELIVLGDIVAGNSTAALAFDAGDDARLILSHLRANPDLALAVLYDDHDKVFAAYRRDKAFVPPAAPGPPRVAYEGERLVLVRPVAQSDKRLGTLYLESSLELLYERIRLYALTALAIVGLSLLIAYLLARRLQRQVSEPILALAGTARAVSDRHDYAARAAPAEGAEFALLTEAFNHMLGQIEAQDRTLRDRESLLRAVLDSSLNAIVVTNAAGAIVDWNARAEKMFGWTKDEALGRKLVDTTVPLAAEQFSPFTDATSGSRAAWPVESLAMRRGGARFPVEIAVRSLRVGNELTFCSFISDITDRRRAQEQLAQLNRELEQRVFERTTELAAANKELEAFSYSVSHDLRAPLRHIEGFASLLREHASGKLDPTAEDFLRRIGASAKRMSKLIEDLLVFSRHGRVELRHERVELPELIDEIRARLTSAEPRRSFRWTVQPLPTVWGDASLLHQVFFNLLDNAVKYTRRREHAEIEIGTTADDSGEATLFVRDNGAGFDPRFQDRLFGVFQRLHSADEFEGTGVGLAIVRRIVQRHGGRTWAEGKPGAGATSFLTLPLVPPGTAIPSFRPYQQHV
ncbi:MAG: PAS domain S-box protein [Opitutae bacterium]|nr:PAS domain S-box protein [Opitutae bacterium]